MIKRQVGAHDYLGMQLIPINMLTPYEKKEFKLDLFNSTDPNDPHNKTPRGQITVEMNFVPFFDDSKKFSNLFDNPGTGSSPHEHDIVSFCGSGLLLVRIISAEDVEGKHRTNPYVKIIFRGEQRKTKVIPYDTCFNIICDSYCVVLIQLNFMIALRVGRRLFQET